MAEQERDPARAARLTAIAERLDGPMIGGERLFMMQDDRDIRFLLAYTETLRIENERLRDWFNEKAQKSTCRNEELHRKVGHFATCYRKET